MITSRQASGNKGRCGQGRGFAMLFAVLTSSILLAIGLSIFNLTIKELALSSSGRESQAAFYAADSGIECGLYWDIVGRVFATSSESASFVPGSAACAGQSLSLLSEDRSSGGATSIFSFAPTDAVDPYRDGGVCALVSISKQYDSLTLRIKTEVVSRGYNVGYAAGSDCSAEDGLKVERGLKVSY